MTANPATMTEAKAMDWMRGVLQGLVYLHECGIAHRDVKLENAALTSDGQVKLIDFGYASVWNAVSKYTPGTEEYISPEQLSRPSKGLPVNLCKADVWAAGILLFTLLTAPTNECDFPWTRADDSSESFRAYRLTGELKRRPWAGFSNAARFLVLNMLMCDPQQRCTAAEALAFINEHWPAHDSNKMGTGKPALVRACSVASTASSVCSGASDSGFDSDASANTVVEEEEEEEEIELLEEGYDSDVEVLSEGTAGAPLSPLASPQQRCNPVKRARDEDEQEQESDRRVKHHCA